MKKILKKWWLWLIIVVVAIIIIITILLNNKTNNVGVGNAGISKEEFEKIKIGMDEFEVNKIIDQEDKWKDDEVYERCVEEISTSRKDGVYNYERKYYGEDSGYAIVKYEVDYSEGFYGLKYPKVVEKKQYDLK